ncbi:anti-phage dCTP deaminase [Lacipirellula parvula]|uniref:Deoxycytidylate deaminase-related protein n=1 Tax=Lacipirellula parvula TaxID=2650471 RepID=A0A5K7XJY3_9BACT|nr:anti-phage dCTP deaminase [Lacipirellula parvula]BBO36457.1 deoxycytidylate deaminase-related protein [Lacipirellula parvula]
MSKVGGLVVPVELNHELDSELVIGLVGAVGTEMDKVATLLEERLKLAGYNVSGIRISTDVIPLLSPDLPSHESSYQRIGCLMTAGNKARENAKDNSVLALGVASVIYAHREKNENGQSVPRPKTAYIVRSLKRPEEVDMLRMMYPSGFILVGVHAEEDRRLKHLRVNLGMSEEEARELVRRDGEELRVPHGQRVNRTFYLADFFLRITDNSERLRADVQRMVEIWFGNPFLTPVFDEYAMFLAFAAALRSADLSRQVGAVVTRDREVLSAGANECPKSGGGLYWPMRDSQSVSVEDCAKGRDYMRGADSNKIEQTRIIDEITQQGRQCGIDEAKLREVLQKSRIGDLTEYGRVVHAEMEALAACARNQWSTVGATLYCTTFPCHNCAKHIIAAGIRRVVYIEPYPKSKALEFHDDSISLTTSAPAPGDRRVQFEPFEGIGPRRFFDLFSCHLGSSYQIKRKDEKTGERMQWSIQNARLRIQMKPCSYLDLELQACKLFQECLNSNVVKK